VHCDAPCDLRLTARHARTRLAAVAEASLAHAGSVTLRLAPSVLASSPWTGLTTIAVQAGAPGGRAVTHAHVRTRVHLLPAPPFAPPLDVHARRTPGGRVIVTWRTALPARRAIYLVQARPITRKSTTADLGYRRGRGRRNFRIVLKPRRSARNIAVIAYSIDRPRHSRTVVVPITG
jgi:hypothetical protein